MVLTFRVFFNFLRERKSNAIKIYCLSVSTRAVIGQFGGSYSPVRPAKI